MVVARRLTGYGPAVFALIALAVLMIGCAAGRKKSIVEEMKNVPRPHVTLETNHGSMTLEIWRDVAPNHADSFLTRTAEGFYDGTIFHRVIDNFMIQGGGYAVGGAPKQVEYTLDAEFNDNPHVEGTLSMARTPDPNSASTQFFVCLGRTPHLDGKYTVFGQLVSGLDVLHAIGRVPCGGQGREKSVPLEEVVLQRAYVSDAEGNPLK